MSRRGWVSVLALVCALVASPVFGQGGSSSATLSGVVVDKDGGNVPGATVVVTKIATGEKMSPQVTNASGAYSFPGLAPGKYKVSISLQGFKTQEIETTLNAGSTNSLNTKLEVGQVTEVVNVTSGTDLVPRYADRHTDGFGNFIQTLPRSDRNALNFLVFLPGVTGSGGRRTWRWSWHDRRSAEQSVQRHDRRRDARGTASGRGRGSVVDDGQRRRGCVGPGCRSGTVRDPLGHEQVRSQRV